MNCIRFILITSFIVFYFIGCFYVGKESYEDIIGKPSTDWSIRDGLTVIISPIAHNLFDNGSPNIKVFVTPYYPSVVLAIERSEQRIKHWSEDEYRLNADKLLKDAVGMYMDWNNNRFVDSRGNYFRTPEQIDSLLFLITIENRSWPCNVPQMTISTQPMIIDDKMQSSSLYAMAPLMKPYDWPCYLPDITNLEERIFLVNDKKEFIKPKYVWGKKKNILTMPETMFAMFHFRKGEHHFLEGSDKMYLVIKGFENDIKLPFSLSMMR